MFGPRRICAGRAPGGLVLESRALVERSASLLEMGFRLPERLVGLA